MDSRIIKSALWEDEPYVVKNPESLFTITKEKQDEDEKSNEEEKIKLELSTLNHSIDEAKSHLKSLNEQANIILNQAKDESDKIISKANEEAEEIKQAALKEAKDLLEREKEKGHLEGFEEGKNQGLNEGIDNAKAIVDDANAKAQRIIKMANDDSQNSLFNSQEKIVEVIVDITKKILNQEFEEMPQLVLQLLQKSLDKVKDQSEVTIKVSPNAYEFALMAKAELQSHLSGNAFLNIVSDDSLAEGDCWVETPNGDVDSSFSSQIKVIEKVLKEAIQKGESM